MQITSARLMATAGILLALASALFGLIKQLLLMALVLVSALGCIVAAWNFRQKQAK